MGDSFKPDNQTSKSPETKIPEYSFNEGVDKSVEKILELIKTLKRDVYVVINGSRIGVGKTFLLGALQRKLTTLGIDVEHSKPMAVKDNYPKVIFDTEQGKLYNIGVNYRDSSLPKNQNIPIGEVGDLYIGIYTPDKPFSVDEGLEPVADIMIRNESAKEDKGKFQYRENE